MDWKDSEFIFFFPCCLLIRLLRKIMCKPQECGQLSKETERAFRVLSEVTPNEWKYSVYSCLPSLPISERRCIWCFSPTVFYTVILGSFELRKYLFGWFFLSLQLCFDYLHSIWGVFEVLYEDFHTQTHYKVSLEEKNLLFFLFVYVTDVFRSLFKCCKLLLVKGWT